MWGIYKSNIIESVFFTQELQDCFLWKGNLFKVYYNQRYNIIIVALFSFLPIEVSNSILIPLLYYKLYWNCTFVLDFSLQWHISLAKPRIVMPCSLSIRLMQGSEPYFVILQKMVYGHSNKLSGYDIYLACRSRVWWDAQRAKIWEKSAIYRGAALCLYHQRRSIQKKNLVNGATEPNTELFIIIFQRRFLEKKTSPKKAIIILDKLSQTQSECTSHISKSVHFCRCN